MTILDAVILGIVEGITEYLPISSTGHLIIMSALLGLDDPAVKPAVDAFNIVIQGGAILAVLGLYRKRVGQMIAGGLGRNRDGLRLGINLVVAFAPAAVLGPLLNDAIELWLFAPVPVAAALALGGVVMIALKPRHDAPLQLEQLTWRHALLIGAAQCIAMWPGTSRSMITIVAGMLVGLPPKRAAEFSFLLALPTLGGACVWRAFKSIRAEENMVETLGWAPSIVGFAVATISAALAVKWLVGYLNRHGLAVFGWYRLALAAAVIAITVRGGPVAESGEVSGRLGDEVAVARANGLAERRAEELTKLVDPRVARLDVVAFRDQRLELDEGPHALDFVEMDPHVVQHP
jgi:undecaprenyl-diphosphatase